MGQLPLLAAGPRPGWYLFYRPIVNVAVAAAAAAGFPRHRARSDAAQVKALEDQIDEQKAANKQNRGAKIALLKERLKADVCTIRIRWAKPRPLPRRAAGRSRAPRPEPKRIIARAARFASSWPAGSTGRDERG